eukprot:gnl/Spiro4/23643_TR11691_c0_g1_i1.p1 gnl/Spiro4/23643_TR11691_c0_g1~~gnl/Spiro4/23643_TR11691_c0_g1_i1.p1  ORF type:complete len:618 (+),score=98.22 gnl/Spiro4/23643_TR11691_c0_g1_i1:57-1856(+)
MSSSDAQHNTPPALPNVLSLSQDGTPATTATATATANATATVSAAAATTTGVSAVTSSASSVPATAVSSSVASPTAAASSTSTTAQTPATTNSAPVVAVSAATTPSSVATATPTATPTAVATPTISPSPVQQPQPQIASQPKPPRDSGASSSTTHTNIESGSGSIVFEKKDSHVNASATAAAVTAASPALAPATITNTSGGAPKQTPPTTTTTHKADESKPKVASAVPKRVASHAPSKSLVGLPTAVDGKSSPVPKHRRTISAAPKLQQAGGGHSSATRGGGASSSMGRSILSRSVAAEDSTLCETLQTYYDRPKMVTPVSCLSSYSSLNDHSGPRWGRPKHSNRLLAEQIHNSSPGPAAYGAPSLSSTAPSVFIGTSSRSSISRGDPFVPGPGNYEVVERNSGFARAAVRKTGAKTESRQTIIDREILGSVSDRFGPAPNSYDVSTSDRITKIHQRSPSFATSRSKSFNYFLRSSSAATLPVSYLKDAARPKSAQTSIHKLYSAESRERDRLQWARATAGSGVMSKDTKVIVDPAAEKSHFGYGSMRSQSKRAALASQRSPGPASYNVSGQSPNSTRKYGASFQSRTKRFASAAIVGL